jgi:hypothetical protein
MLRETLSSATLMPHAQEMKRGIQHVQIIERHFRGGVAFYIVTKSGPGARPAETNFVQLICLHVSKIETGLDGVAREGCVVFYAADALFGDGKKQFSIADDARRGIMHL